MTLRVMAAHLLIFLYVFHIAHGSNFRKGFEQLQKELERVRARREGKADQTKLPPSEGEPTPEPSIHAMKEFSEKQLEEALDLQRKIFEHANCASWAEYQAIQ